jgi:transcriptional regulator with XRE-family HTH domain
LPYLPVTLKCLKPNETDFEPKTLGEHLRKRRLELRLTQREAATRLGETAITVLHWEKGQTEPPIETMPRILSFLGYDPFPQPETLSERLRAMRRANAWTIKEAARHLGVDEGTWGRWERSAYIPWARCRRMVEEFPGRKTCRA